MNSKDSRQYTYVYFCIVKRWWTILKVLHSSEIGYEEDADIKAKAFIMLCYVIFRWDFGKMVKIRMSKNVLQLGILLIMKTILIPYNFGCEFVAIALTLKSFKIII